MATQPENQVERMLDSFLAAIRPWRHALRFARLRYVGIVGDGFINLIAGRIVLSPNPLPRLLSTFRGAGLQAGEMALSGHDGVERCTRETVWRNGFKVDRGGKLLRLPVQSVNDVTAGSPELLHPEGLGKGDRLGVFGINGQRHQLNVKELDWGLKSAVPPFDSLSELLREYGLGFSLPQQSTLELIAASVAQVWERSAVVGTKSTVGIWLPGGLRKDRARLSVRIVHQGSVVARKSFRFRQMKWLEYGAGRVGALELDVPSGAVVQCIACYADTAHQQRWIGDPAIFQNPRAAILSKIDPKFGNTRAFLSPSPSAKKAHIASDFEDAVAWILWSLGFAPAVFGGNARTTDAADIVAASPRGDYLVVECTLGLLPSDSKLSKVIARAEIVRTALRESELTALRVVPMIVTALSKEQIKADAARAKEAGVVIVAREELSRVHQELEGFPNADAWFERAFQASTTEPGLARTE